MNSMFEGPVESQLRFLQLRVYATLALGVLGIILAIWAPNGLSGISLAFMVMWGFPVVKSLFGITTIGALFSGNVVIGLLLFILYLVISILAGYILAVVGVCRYFYLKTRKV